ncbi:GNAT family N-acetyltransferase [Aliikangiella maris]|uniref:GNAT family N-acetyltransferase n=2 Tax=Aliikangiella maris TaxID=3162458 RepID=A0ABV3MIX8_9GAMM
MSTIDLATNEQQIADTFEVMLELRPGYTLDSYLAQVKKQMDIADYQLAALTHENQVCCVAGFRITESLAWGKFMYVDDLVTSSQVRSANFGKQMIDWLIQQAESQGCREFHLDSGVQRHGAHRFYLRERMDITCYHFMRKLTD